MCKFLDRLGQRHKYVNVLNICVRKPELLKVVRSYISHGDVISKLDFENINNDSNDGNDDNQIDYTESLKFLKLLINDMNINISIDNTIKILKHFNGHLNLSMRYILNTCTIGQNYNTNTFISTNT